MSITTRLAARQLRLRPARTHRVGIDRDLTIPTADGDVELRADRYYPRHDSHPPLVIGTTARAAYDLTARLLAERGYQVLVVATTANAATARRSCPPEWLRRQPWYPTTITELSPHTMLTQLQSP